MLGNVIVGAFSVDTLAVIECMYCIHGSRVDLSGCPCFSSCTPSDRANRFSCEAEGEEIAYG